MPTILYNWKIGGEAGYGIMNTGGPIFAKTLTRGGFFVFIYAEYPSLIRGGHNTMQVAVSQEPVSGPYQKIDLLVALNAHTIVAHQNELKPGGIILYDTNTIKMIDQHHVDNSRIPPLSGAHTVNQARAKTKLRDDVTFLPMALEDIAEKVGGNKIMQNVVAVGASLALFDQKVAADQERDLIKLGNSVLADVFSKKGDDVIKANQKALEAGYQEVSRLSSYRVNPLTG